MSRSMKGWAMGWVAIAWLWAWPTWATPTFGTWDVKSLFFIAKSENENEVHYGVKVDGQCAAIGREPVFAYWLMRDRTPPALEDLGFWETPAYGIASQAVKGTTIRLVLRALGERPIDVRIAKGSTGCDAAPMVTIAKAPARLHHVYVDVGFFGPRSLTLVGVDGAGTAVTEVISK